MPERIPKYFFFRIFLFALLLYFMLVLPVGSILSLKHGPDWIRSQGQNMLADTTIQQDTSSSFGFLNVSRDADTSGRGDLRISTSASNNSKGFFSKALQDINRMLLISLIVGLGFSIPFKRYFKRKRKGKRISPKLRSFCKKYLLHSPAINAGILSLAFAIIHILMLYYLVNSEGNPAEDLEKKLFTQFFYISLVASVLVVLFLYFWQRHRVHLRYIEHLYTPEELMQRISGNNVFRIRNRMWISSAMTTLLPLGIVIFYLFLSLTSIRDLNLGNISEEQAGILFGKYLSFFSGLPQTEFSANYFYVNVIDSILMFIGIFTGILISLVYIVFFVRWNTEDIVSPVKQLISSMERTGEGKLEQYSLVRSGDEVGQLTEGYNRMVKRLKAYIDNINGLTETYSHFVPRQFLDILGKENYTDIKLGDQIEKEMTVLFSDIRSFTSLSESMTPKQNFDFINAYLGVMEPVIRKHNGFIDKYIGDAIMALFPNSPEDAVQAAISMRQALNTFNKSESRAGQTDINCGIGIHTGKLMLGIVGAEGRMDGTVISDAVNLAARLEGLTKNYEAAAIISKESIAKLKNPDQWTFRYLDRTKVKGKQEEVTIYEIVEAAPPALFSKKMEGLSDFNTALLALEQGDFLKAEKSITEFLKRVPEDPAALKILNKAVKERSE